MSVICSGAYTIVACTCISIFAYISTALQTSGWEEHDQTIATDQITKYIGDRRGIQGHQSSSHIDATIFGMFALSDVFDSLFLDSGVREPQREISEMLWRGIVNPLRR